MRVNINGSGRSRPGSNPLTTPLAQARGRRPVEARDAASPSYPGEEEPHESCARARSSLPETRGGCRGPVGAVAGGSNPLKRPMVGREGTALDAKGQERLDRAPVSVRRPVVRPEVAVEAGPPWKPHEGKTRREVRVLLRRWRGSEGENPMSAASSIARMGSLEPARSCEEQRRQRRRNVRGAICRGWDPGAAPGRAFAQAPGAGRFADWNVLKGTRTP